MATTYPIDTGRLRRAVELVAEKAESRQRLPADHVLGVASDEPASRVGEPGALRFALGVCNAIFAATDKRASRRPIGEQRA